MVKWLLKIILRYSLEPTKFGDIWGNEIGTYQQISTSADYYVNCLNHKFHRSLKEREATISGAIRNIS